MGEKVGVQDGAGVQYLQADDLAILPVHVGGTASVVWQLAAHGVPSRGERFAGQIDVGGVGHGVVGDPHWLLLGRGWGALGVVGCLVPFDIAAGLAWCADHDAVVFDPDLIGV